MRHSLAALALLALPLLPETAVAQRQRAPGTAPRPTIDSAWYASLRYRHIGPEGNRVSSVAGIAGDPNVYYAGAASGGVWKTTDGGVRWQPIFDSQPVSSIGALAVAPSDPNVVWAGTGEPFIRSNISLGWGMFRSTDAGKTWAKMGLDNTGRIGRIVIHPTNPDVVFATALGHGYGPQPDRGVYRTTDGGKTWEKVLFVNDSTGAYDIVMDPNNPRILFASTWHFEVHTWGRTSGGAGSGIWMSADGGSTWKRLTGSALPKKYVGKIALAMSKANSNRVYALIETGDGVPVNGEEQETGELFRSDDGGTAWQVISHDRNLAGRSHYYTRMGVMPDDDNEAYFLTASWTKTLDGGKTSIDPPFANVPGGDHHDIWIDHTNGGRMIVGHDGGLSITTNRGSSWLRIQLPIAQMYHVTVDNAVPYFVYGNMQDGPSSRGPSNSKVTSFFGDGGITRGMWHSVGGGESGWATPDPVDPNLVWSSASGYGSLGGIVSRYDVRTGIAENVEVWPQLSLGHTAAEVKYRFHWTFPLTLSPHDRNKVYVGSQHVHVTTNGGRQWSVISPDLTRNDKSRQGFSGGLTGDNLGVEYSGVVFAIAESRLKAGLLWAGTNDGLVHVSQDGGRSWTNVSAGIVNAPSWGTISNIEPSRFDSATAYISIDAHQSNNRDPFIYKTSDYGKTWRLITSGIPKSPLSYVHVVREDPVRRGLLYAGTENGVYVSFDDGDNWQPLQNNLPHAPVYSIAIQEHFNDLVIGTYGRGFWILDDITPLRHLAAEVTAKQTQLLEPRFAYRFRMIESPRASFDDPVTGANPPYGAALNYWLKTEAKDSAKLEIRDATGKLVRTMKGPTKPGLNRVWWDLSSDLSKEARIRVAPLHAPEFVVGNDGRPAPSIGRVSTLLPPGRYSVKLTAGDQESTVALDVRKDPNSGGSDAEIRAQMELLGSVMADADSVVTMINSVELVRGQLAALKSFLASDSTAKDVRAQVDTLDRKLVAVEEQMFQMKITGRGQDLVRWPAKLAEQLLYLAGTINAADVSPTAQQREVAGILKEQARALRTQLDRVMNTDLASFRRLLQARNIQQIISEP